MIQVWVAGKQKCSLFTDSLLKMDTALILRPKENQFPNCYLFDKS